MASLSFSLKSNRGKVWLIFGESFLLQEVSLKTFRLDDDDDGDGLRLVGSSFLPRMANSRRLLSLIEKVGHQSGIDVVLVLNGHIY